YQSAMGMTETESGPPKLPPNLYSLSPAPCTLASIREEMGDCKRCKLHQKRKNIVFGTGNEKAGLVFVGEGPGEDEDIEGLPFVGRAGQLLTKIIEAMGMKRSDVYIANIVKCRPPNNRNPEHDEIECCFPFLKRQLEAISPPLIVALGTFAAQTLLGSRERISQMRGRFHSYNGIKVMPTFHPSYLLRNPDEKRVVWEDMKMVMEELKKMSQK
ncbi:MAG: uracil-DNA glycosylase, partial [Nitrospirota bacterium]